MTSTKLSNLFITGCDDKTEWMLPWFVENFRRHNPDANLRIFDFGMKANPFPDMTIPHYTKQAGWFKKPSAMIKATQIANRVCWLDTDCEIMGSLGGIFDHVYAFNRLAMVEDKPWSTRRSEKWHNSGVVAFMGTPEILKKWAAAVDSTPTVGDQEVLHGLLGQGLSREIHITDLPNKYNVLRLQIQDGTVPQYPIVMHWTGAKGKDHIRKLLNG
jgi:hypothetical protein